MSSPNAVYEVTDGVRRADDSFEETMSEDHQDHRYHFWMAPGGAVEPNRNYPLCTQSNMNWKQNWKTFASFGCEQKGCVAASQYGTIHVTIDKSWVTCQACLELIHS